MPGKSSRPRHHLSRHDDPDRAQRALAYREQGHIWKDVAETFGYANDRSARTSVLSVARDEAHRLSLMALAPERVPYAQTDNGRGYLVMVQRGHPLANHRGMVYVHRVVLYEKVGPGVHPCHYCGKRVAWALTREVDHLLEVDHLDEDKANNSSENLVPCCRQCNSGRNKGKKRGLLTHCRRGGHPLSRTRNGTPYCLTCRAQRKASP